MADLDDEFEALFAAKKATAPKPKSKGIAKAIAQHDKQTRARQEEKPARGQPAPARAPTPAKAPSASQRMLVERGKAVIEELDKVMTSIEKAPAPVLPDGPGSTSQALGYKGVRPAAFVADRIDPRWIPKRWQPGELQAGQSVWYCNQRYYVHSAPPDWSKTVHVTICTDRLREGAVVPKDACFQHIHPDALERAEVKGVPGITPQETKHAQEVKAKMKAEGVSDVGDDVALQLRGKDLEQAYKIAAKYLGSTVEQLKAKYGKLNPGQQRMNLGNRMRGLAKKRGG